MAVASRLDEIQFSTLLGGDRYDDGRSRHVDAIGNIYFPARRTRLADLRAMRTKQFLQEEEVEEAS